MGIAHLFERGLRRLRQGGPLRDRDGLISRGFEPSIGRVDEFAPNDVQVSRSARPEGVASSQQIDENAGYRGALEALQREVGDLRRDHDGYKRAFEILNHEIGPLRAERSALEATLERVRRSKHSLPPALCSRQLCFLHIGKTAGTSLHHMLLEALPDADVFHASVVDFDGLEDGSLAGFDLVMGHFTFRHVPKFRHDPCLLTFLRDPVERVISTYHFLKTWSGQDDNTSSEALRGAKTLSLRDFLLSDDPAIRMFTSNHQTNVIAQDYRPEYGSGGDALAVAREHLDRFWFVGIVEAFDRSVRLLSDKLGLRDPLPLKRLNVTRERVEYGRPPPEEIEIIADLNRLDIELYRLARLDFERRYASAFDTGPAESSGIARDLQQSRRRR